MKPRHLLIIAMVGILLVPYSSSDEFVKCTCAGKCHGRDVKQSATKLYEVFSISEGEECFQRAKRSFGAHCGGLANCNSGCVEADKIPLNFDCGGPLRDIRAGDGCTLSLFCGENCECDSQANTCWPKDLPKASKCCMDWCSGFLADKPAYYGCIQSCEAGCRTNDLTNQFISVFQYIAVVIAA
ncbi:MAG: hypothetical protein KJ928_04260, partial [Candidatus Altiarchaeota archaeon]|nr:hypothetical protein [Candidatus Altiarchaeota archaeon]